MPATWAISGRRFVRRVVGTPCAGRGDKEGLVKSQARTGLALFGGAAAMILAVGCGGGDNGGGCVNVP